MGGALLGAIIGVVGFVLGVAADFFFKIGDRLVGRRMREGDLAAVSISYQHWYKGAMPVPIEQRQDGSWVDAVDGIAFPIEVTNGSSEKITNVRSGLRWRTGGEVIAEQTPVLLPGEKRTALAWERQDDPEWDWMDFEQDWLSRLAYFVQFDDQRRGRWENTLDPTSDRPWGSARL